MNRSPSRATIAVFNAALPVPLMLFDRPIGEGVVSESKEGIFLPQTKHCVCPALFFTPQYGQKKPSFRISKSSLKGAVDMGIRALI